MNITEIIKSEKPVAFRRNVFHDHRGFFIPFENDPAFTQTNVSFSKEGTFRGLHYQEEPYAQGKLLTVLSGKILDFFVNLTPNDKDMLPINYVGLTAPDVNTMGSKNTVWVPPGYAHGFFAEKDSIIAYQVTGPYMPSHEKTLFWNDPRIQDTYGRIELRQLFNHYNSRVIISPKDNPFENDTITW